MGDETPINPAAVCKIIDSCKKAGVVKLDFGQLHISFAPEAEILHNQKTAIIKKETLAELERDSDLNEIMLSDPARYEEILQKENE